MIKKITTTLSLLAVLAFVCTLTGCAHNNIGAPCANFGKWCRKEPINSWNYNK